MTTVVEAIDQVSRTWILTQDALSIIRREVHLQSKNTETTSRIAGQAKGIKKYRDWVAHRNPRKPTPARVDPQTARELLKIIAAALDAE
ncbi:MAG: hypothetical protein NTX45_26865 [Proteobacteria bacterium]|nr:hypothetical protein [Pseudomonadota bacterium]